jgi:hypothetical protein
MVFLKIYGHDNPHSKKNKERNYSNDWVQEIDMYE